jgi:hypothetical protein
VQPAGFGRVLKWVVLAPITHQRPATAADAPHPTVFSPIGVLDVLSSTTPRPSSRKHRWVQHLAALATKPGEKWGLAVRASGLASALRTAAVAHAGAGSSSASVAATVPLTLAAPALATTSAATGGSVRIVAADAAHLALRDRVVRRQLNLGVDLLVAVFAGDPAIGLPIRWHDIVPVVYQCTTR